MKRRRKVKIPRPPREWAKHVIAGIKESGSADDPNAVMGSLWYNKMTPRERTAVKRRYGR